MAGQTEDHRTRDTDAPQLWAVATDSFLSGWGHSPREQAAGHWVGPRKSYVAYPIYTDADRRELIHWMDQRGDYIRVRVNVHLPRVPDGCHLAIMDRPLCRYRAQPHARMTGEAQA